MNPITLVTVNAGLGAPSSSRMLAEALAERFGDTLTNRNIAYSVTHVDLREYATAIANNFVTGYAEASLQKVLDEVQTADALVVVTPVFNASFSGLFKSFFDLIDTTALESKPVVLGATGGSERHSLVLEHAMRPLFSYLKAQPVSTAVFAATADWGTNDDVAKQLEGRIGRAARELADQVQLRTGGSSANGRGRELAPDPGEPVDVAGADTEAAAAEHDAFASLMERFASTTVK